MSYARKAVTRMTLDMSRVDLQRSETVTLLDTNRRWEVTLTNGGTPFRLPNNWTASMVGVKPDEDENGLMLYCSVVDGRIIFDFAENEQLTTCAGMFPVQFDVWNEYGKLVASPKIWLHVLPDVRPHEDLKSTGQYTTIGDLIAAEQANREDIDENAEGIKANADDIAELNTLLYGYREGEDGDPGEVKAHVEAVSAEVAKVDKRVGEVNEKLTTFLGTPPDAADTLSEVLGLISANADAIKLFESMGGAPLGSGTLVVPADTWSDGSPTTAIIDLDGDYLRKGSVMLIVPADNYTKEAASKARLTVQVDASGEYEDESEMVVLLRATGFEKPTADMTFAFVILQTSSEADALVTLIGVDAAGDPAPTLVDLSGFEGVEQEDGSIKGVIVETYADETTRTTEVTYDAEGNIVQIGETVIRWTAAGEEG